MGSLGELDQRLFTRVAAAWVPGADPALRRLSHAADHGRLWLGTAAGLTLVGGHTARRAAVRGLGSLALASLAVNTLVKWSARRPRPLLDGVPRVRLLERQPHTTSFPSGHSASAAAFATGVALESTRYGAVVAPVAAGVAFSRVYVGVHFPGDVLAGVAIGAGAAFLTCRWWPPRAAVPERERPVAPAPALPLGRGLVVFVNGHAGAGAPASAMSPADRLRDLLPEAELVERGADGDFAALLTEAADRAAAAGGALGVCGGDGSVNAAPAPRRTRPGAGGVPRRHPQPLRPRRRRARLRVHRRRRERGRGGGGRPRRGPPGRRAGPAVPQHLQHRALPRTRAYPAALGARWGKWPAAAMALARVLRTARPIELELNGRPAGCGCSSRATDGTSPRASPRRTGPAWTTDSSTCVWSPRTPPRPDPGRRLRARGGAASLTGLRRRARPLGGAVGRLRYGHTRVRR